MTLVFEFLWWLLIDIVIAGPGAFLLWAAKGFRGSYSDILLNERNKSDIAGFIFWVISLLLLGLVARSLR